MQDGVLPAAALAVVLPSAAADLLSEAAAVPPSAEAEVLPEAEAQEDADSKPYIIQKSKEQLA